MTSEGGLKPRLKPRLKHLFTVNELREALDQLVADEAAIGGLEFLMEGADGYEHWSGPAGSSSLRPSTAR